MPYYRGRARQLLELLSKTSDDKWTKAHMAAMNKLASIVSYKLGLVDFE